MAEEEFEYAGPNGADDGGHGDDDGPESLAEFLTQERGGPIPDRGEQDESEEEDLPDPKASKANAKEEPSDDGGDTDDEPKDPRAESHSRMVRKLAQRERELSEHRAQVKERDRRIAELEQRVRAAEADDGDDISLLRSRAARRLGVKADDPKVNEYLFELSRDVTLDHLGDAVESDPDLKRIREERRAERQRRDERRELESRIERIERERQEAEQRANRAQATAAVGQFLSANSERHPFLMAQNDVDPVETVSDLAFEAIRTGQFEVRRGESQDQAAGRLLQTIAGNLDAHYRGLAEALSKKLRPAADSADDDIDVPTERAGKAKKQAQGKRTGTTGTGGGGRGRPSAQPREDDDEEETLGSFMRRELSRDAAGRRGR